MGLFGSETFNSLEDLFKHNLEDIYDAESRLIEALPKMAEKATAAHLKQAFESHREETKVQKARLEQVFEAFGWEPERETCPAMKGLIKEGEEMINADGDNDTIDAALIMSAQRVEHYEIAAYGAAVAHAKQLGRDNVAEILQKTLDEEYAADEKLNQIAVSKSNPNAAIA
ncbi:MAG: ferritin-like domain-containing protein [Planctomycetota bacterium]